MARKQRVRVLVSLLASIAVTTVLGVPAFSQEAKRTALVEKAWYTPTELLTSLAQRDGIQWALPETLARDVEKAIGHCRQALALAPRDIDANYWMGVALLRRGPTRDGTSMK